MKHWPTPRPEPPNWQATIWGLILFALIIAGGCAAFQLTIDLIPNPEIAVAH